MLHEMLANLLDNAIRYTPPHGTVTVTVSIQEDIARLIVEDNGTGIPASERNRVFERFHRLSDSTGEGCGLGLAIVREIALAHQAEISVNDGLEGTGTRISITLPVTPAAKSI
jgi:two-component system sensor histidine kinase TctE